MVAPDDLPAEGLTPPPRIIYRPMVRNALMEDLGRAGDLTSEALIPIGGWFDGFIRSRKDGVIAGLEVAVTAFNLIDPSIGVQVLVPDGTRVHPNTAVLKVDGPARGVLTAERTALNFVGRMSGIATLTRAHVDAVAGTKARICCTRKTMPGLRALDKYAVRCGGGYNHRFGLDDAILIKDNHLAVVGSIEDAIAKARAHVGHMVKIEIEVETPEEAGRAAAAGADCILLDNMSTDDLARSVGIIAGRAATEASGNVSLETVRAIAETGVDYISSGALTHSAPNFDVGLDAI